jgi:hypothetical protein
MTSAARLTLTPAMSEPTTFSNGRGLHAQLVHELGRRIAAGELDPTVPMVPPASMTRTPLLNPFHPFLLGYAALPEGEVREAFQNPAITHFTGPVKPWHAGCTDPAAAEWWGLWAATAFDKKTSAWSRLTSSLRPER